MKGKVGGGSIKGWPDQGCHKASRNPTNIVATGPSRTGPTQPTGPTTPDMLSECPPSGPCNKHQTRKGNISKGQWRRQRYMCGCYDGTSGTVQILGGGGATDAALRASPIFGNLVVCYARCSGGGHAEDCASSNKANQNSAKPA
jgi:hypothetical protein